MRKGRIIGVALLVGGLSASAAACGSSGPSEVRRRECAGLGELSKQLHVLVDAKASVKQLETAKEVEQFVAYHRARAQATREASQSKDDFTEPKVKAYAERLRKAYAQEADANEQVAKAYEQGDREAVAAAGRQDLAASQAQVELMAEWTEQCLKP